MKGNSPLVSFALRVIWGRQNKPKANLAAQYRCYCAQELEAGMQHATTSSWTRRKSRTGGENFFKTCSLHGSHGLIWTRPRPLGLEPSCLCVTQIDFVYPVTYTWSEILFRVLLADMFALLRLKRISTPRNILRSIQFNNVPKPAWGRRTVSYSNRSRGYHSNSDIMKHICYWS